MFRKFSLRDLAIIAVLLDEEEEGKSPPKKPKKTKTDRKWVRRSDKEFYALYNELLDNETKFYRYFGISTYQFNDLLLKIKPIITKKNTSFREAITPTEKLAVLLR